MLRIASFWMVAVALLTAFTSDVKADEWFGMKEESRGHTRAKGNVEYREDGNDVVIKVNVWTKVRGRSRTGRGHAIYTIFKADGQVYRTIDARKYASTNVSQNERERDSSTEVRIPKAEFNSSLDTDELLVFAEEKGGMPNNINDMRNWLKSFSNEIDKAVSDVSKSAVGSVKEGGNWIVKKRR
ncbi:hypothetical protein [Singulisphaera acidiphila]|nr:hypothetical protein [Singulisphaera acidiphila]